MTGYIHIYCGDGKGKTTAAEGLAVRAAGTGLKVLFIQFMKSGKSGEIGILRNISGIEYLPCDRNFGFVWNMTSEEKIEAGKYYQEFFLKTIEKAVKEDFDLLVMDEFMSAYNYDFIRHEDALMFLKKKPEGLEVILTGRNPKSELLDLADYVTEMKKIRHPYDKGIAARKGIEM